MRSTLPRFTHRISRDFKPGTAGNRVYTTNPYKNTTKRTPQKELPNTNSVHKFRVYGLELKLFNVAAPMLFSQQPTKNYRSHNSCMKFHRPKLLEKHGEDKSSLKGLGGEYPKFVPPCAVSNMDYIRECAHTRHRRRFLSREPLFRICSQRLAFGSLGLCLVSVRVKNSTLNPTVPPASLGE